MHVYIREPFPRQIHFLPRHPLDFNLWGQKLIKNTENCIFHHFSNFITFHHSDLQKAHLGLYSDIYMGSTKHYTPLMTRRIRETSRRLRRTVVPLRAALTPLRLPLLLPLLSLRRPRRRRALRLSGRPATTEVWSIERMWRRAHCRAWLHRPMGP